MSGCMKVSHGLCSEDASVIDPACVRSRPGCCGSRGRGEAGEAGCSGGVRHELRTEPKPFTARDGAVRPGRDSLPPGPESLREPPLGLRCADPVEMPDRAGLHVIRLRARHGCCVRNVDGEGDEKSFH
ncbi:unnamed protein product [Pleuronectes platessa]|uniref:Uncharacterized protein n=1 Tax=Pleuronectes platessa TaxID=8262 RepID=A0A9N7YJ41_PLEPL|nr:unnamed protein product [Pleuronectes platessa]